MQTISQVSNVDILDADSVVLVDPESLKEMQAWGPEGFDNSDAALMLIPHELDIAVELDNANAVFGALDLIARVRGNLPTAPRQLLDKLIVLRKYPDAYLYDMTSQYGSSPTWWIHKNKDLSDAPLVQGARTPGFAWSEAALCIQNGHDELKFE